MVLLILVFNVLLTVLCWGVMLELAAQGKVWLTLAWVIPTTLGTVGSGWMLWTIYDDFWNS